MTPPGISVSVLTPEDVDARRHELLDSVGATLDELRVRAHDYDLNVPQLEVLRELELLEFLSGS